MPMKKPETPPKIKALLSKINPPIDKTDKPKTDKKLNNEQIVEMGKLKLTLKRVSLDSVRAIVVDTWGRGRGFNFAGDRFHQR